MSKNTKFFVGHGGSNYGISRGAGVGHHGESNYGISRGDGGGLEKKTPAAEPHAFRPYTPRGCAPGFSPAWVVPNGIDTCIVNVAREMNLPLDSSLCLAVQAPFRRRVQQECQCADNSIQDHQLRCLSPAMRNLLWRAGAGQDTDGMPLVAEDGRLVFADVSLISEQTDSHHYDLLDAGHGGAGGLPDTTVAEEYHGRARWVKFLNHWDVNPNILESNL